MRILVTGSREWSDRQAIYNILVGYTNGAQGEQITLVHGDCPTGADAIANDVAELLGWTIEKHPADWALHGKAAGPKRNQEMVDLGADVVLAFPLGLSKGTRGCMKMARKAGLLVVNYGDPE